MKVNNLLVFLLLLVGLIVGVMSLYTASLSGVMVKMGLYGGEFSNSIKFNDLSRRLRNEKDDRDCSMFAVTKDIPAYFLADGEQKIKLAGSLGNARIECGVRHVQEGNVQRGVYAMIKGLYYLKNEYNWLRTIVQQDRAKCELLDMPDYERWVENYLLSTDGRIHEVVYDLYKQVEAERNGVEELCTN